MENVPIEKKGFCLYDNDSEYEVRIIKWHTRYGTGDYEDPIEIREDQIIECYYVWFENMIDKGIFNASGGSYLTLDEAIKSVEARVQVRWITL